MLAVLQPLRNNADAAKQSALPPEARGRKQFRKGATNGSSLPAAAAAPRLAARRAPGPRPGLAPAAAQGSGTTGRRRGGSGRCSRRRAAGHHHDAGADLDALEQVGDVLVQHADAARGDELADGRGLVGAVDAVHGRAEIHGARTERITGAAGHEARQVGLALDHFGRRMPVRPLGLLGDLLHAGPGKAVAANAHAVADGASATEHVIEVGVGRIDDQGAGGLLGGEGNFLPAQMRRQLYLSDFRLLFRRQRREHQRLAVGADLRLLLLGHRTGDGGRSRTDRPGRTQKSSFE